MTAAVVVVAAVFAYIGALALALLWAAGCRQADRIESRWVRDEAVRRTFEDRP